MPNQKGGIERTGKIWCRGISAPHAERLTTLRVSSEAENREPNPKIKEVV